MQKSLYGVKTLILIVAIGTVLSSVDRSCAGFENGSSESGTLYFFTNEGCRPCKQLEPILRGLADRGYPVTKVDTTAYPQWVNQFRISSTPTVVLVKGNREITRRSGFVDAATVERWFNSVGISPGSRQTPGPASSPATAGTSQESFIEQADSERNADRLDRENSTVLQGTRIPGNKVEQRAMDATVRIRVEDPEGVSFATGTIIHCRDHQWLVITCGHVFRDSGGKGEISVEYGFGDETLHKAPGELLKYDADSRDVGLIAVSADRNVTPVPLADRNALIQRSDSVFSIGCDHGNPPTIRRTKIKRTAAYFDDKITKYDIYGRPVDGRSGGGLFTTDGKLIGVCNAAAVDFDEGIYTALDTVYWQVANANLSHLFVPEAQTELVGIAQKTNNNPTSVIPGKAEIADMVPLTTPFERNGPTEISRAIGRQAPERFADNRPMGSSIRKVGLTQDDNTPPARPSSNDMEVILIVRSKIDPTHTEAITLSDPSPQLLKYLEKIGNRQTGKSRVDMAQLRQQLGPKTVLRR